MSPVELVRRALVNGYTAMAITDHAGVGTLERVLSELKRDCALASDYWDITALPGVELTHVPAKAIADTVKKARDLGAEIVIVHGETIVEPVEPGTNLAAVRCVEVDVLAHPGFLTVEEAEAAARNGIFLEISARKGHSLANGHVVRVAASVGARLVLNSDAHAPEDLLTHSFARMVARGAGITEDEVRIVLIDNPQSLLKRLMSGR
ncbi:MAG: histidinol phosphate phosphatase domain-containing protein [Dehalococcoidia bacterium]|nr:histidinol phosphate phosphatase domain-containing protein [Dehalococcoidia bacterium]